MITSKYFIFTYSISFQTTVPCKKDMCTNNGSKTHVDPLLSQDARQDFPGMTDQLSDLYGQLQNVQIQV